MTKKYLFFISFLVILFTTSCVVSKKKYEGMVKAKNKSIDSVQNLLNKNIKEYNANRNSLTENNAKKNAQIESLIAENKKLTADTVSLNKSLQNAINDYKKEKQNLMNVSKDLDNKAKLIDSLSLAIKAKEEKLNELNQMIERNKAETEKLKNIVSQALNAFDKSELTVYQKDGKVYVAMEEKLLFKSGSATVDKKGIDALKQLAGIMEKNPDIEINIEGHTDNVGDAKYNWDLSARRAISIVNILQENSKIDPKRFVASGRGMYSPVADNETQEGKQKNRRIDIILSPKLDQLYKVLNEK